MPTAASRAGSATRTRTWSTSASRETFPCRSRSPAPPSLVFCARRRAPSAPRARASCRRSRFPITRWRGLLIAAERERLAGPFLIVAFAAVFAGMLVAVFPPSDEYADFASTQQPNAFSVAYLQALSRANPNDDKIRLVYARHLANVGRAADALEA